MYDPYLDAINKNSMKGLFLLVKPNKIDLKCFCNFIGIDRFISNNAYTAHIHLP